MRKTRKESKSQNRSVKCFLCISAFKDLKGGGQFAGRPYELCFGAVLTYRAAKCFAFQVLSSANQFTVFVCLLPVINISSLTNWTKRAPYL